MRGRGAKSLTRFVVLGLLWGCGDGDLRKVPPLPDVADCEPAVAQKLRRLHEAMVATPTAEAWAAYARTLDAHDLPEAADAYVVAAGHTAMPAKFDLLYLAGRSCIKRDPDRAIGLLEQADQLRGDYHPLQLRLAGLYQKAQRLADARRRFERAHELKPTSLSLVGMGRLSLIEGRVPEAIGTLEKARAMNPDHAEVYAALAEAYARAGRGQDAASASALAGDLEHEYGYDDPIASVMARESVSFSGLLQFGHAALRGRQFDQAVAAIDGALLVRPDDLEAVSVRAQALVGLQRYEEAGPLLDRVLLANPDDAQALTFRAGCSMARHDAATAAVDLRRAVAVDPRHLQARWNLARCLRGLKQNEGAKEHLVILLQRRPGMTDAHLMLASILAESGDRAGAMTHIAYVLAQEPSNRQALELRESLR